MEALALDLRRGRRGHCPPGGIVPAWSTAGLDGRRAVRVSFCNRSLQPISAA